MSNEVYSLSQTTDKRCLGRQGLISTIENLISPPAPKHVSIIGPKMIGKTIVLREVADRIRGTDQYSAVVFWDVRRNSPTSDFEMIAALSGVLKEGLKTIDFEIAELLSVDAESHLESLKDVFELLDEEKMRLLLIMDFIDYTLSSPLLTRNVWDNLRNLAQLGSLTLVTGSRLRLRELCASPEARTSDFWNIFYETPLKIGPVSEEELLDYITPLAERGVDVQESARKELMNWTGGIPVLLSAVLGNVDASGPVTNDSINAVADRVLSTHRDYLDELYEDCSLEEKEVLEKLTQTDPINQSEVSPDGKDGLEQRGFAETRGTKLHSTCRLMLKHVNRLDTKASDVRRLFGTTDSFGKNIKATLQVRLEQIRCIDPKLSKEVQKAINSLPEAADCFKWMRGIVSKALSFIWRHELPDGQIPPELSASWKASGLRDVPEGPVPLERAAGCRLVKILADGRNEGDVRVSSGSAHLLYSIKAYGDFGAHWEENNHPPSLDFAVAACQTAVALCAQLTSDYSDSD